MKAKDCYVIIKDDNQDGHDLFWNNKFGWVEWPEAEIFSEYEKNNLNWPMGGVWIDFLNFFSWEK